MKALQLIPPKSAKPADARIASRGCDSKEMSAIYLISGPGDWTSEARLYVSEAKIRLFQKSANNRRA